MTNPIAQTTSMPRTAYLELIADYSRAMQAQSDKEAPRALELRTKIEALAAKARDLSVMLDDESTRKNPAAAAIRADIDTVFPEFQALAAAAQERALLANRLHARAKTISHTSDEIIQVPAGEAMVLLHLMEPALTPSAD